MNDIRDPLADRARSLFDGAVRGVDAATAARLRSARRAALQPRHAPIARFLLPAGAFAAAALALGLVWHPHAGAPATPAVTVAAAASSGGDSLAVADAADLDLYQNLDFYDWLATQPQQPGVAPAPAGD
ncbi:MAG: hypothetical protein KGI40_04465 [Xanthomonadaceae bacterium]|nr:hypothetical protein [Xanthomonadaceae bacterium]MDE2178481.1 hypothetical protein [Xanthomonadaceae bacterium]MDE2245260.1 hypothetical protein [Xanthomonadaceae bacterium]